MFRSSQMRTLSCPLRSLLLRDYAAAACSEHNAAARTLQGRSSEVIHRPKESSSILTKTLPCSTQLPASCSHPKDHLLRETSPKCPCCKDFSRTFSHLQPQGVPASQTILSSVARTLKKELLVRNCTYQQWLLNQRLGKLQPCGVYLNQFRAASYVAPREVKHRDCLSPENENRCRQLLGPNLKLYETTREQKRGWIQNKAKNQARWASVLVSLCSVGSEPAVLFTLRSSTLKGRHKGDVSFAGGKSDPSDRDVVDTALREAKEELGVTVTADSVWGTLKPLRDWSGMMIAPVLANLGPIEELTFKPNPGEVEEIFTLSVSHLCNPQNCGYTHFRTGDKYGYTMPVFRNGKHRVWGLTAVALDHTLKLIVPVQGSQ